MTSKSPIFIGGAGRAGTRLLRSIIGKIPTVFEIPRETYFFVSKSKSSLRVKKEIDSISDKKEKQKAYLLFTLLSIFYKQEIALKKFLVLKNNFSKIQATWVKHLIDSRSDQDSKIISMFQKIQPHVNSIDRFEIFDFVIDCLCEEHNCERWVEKTPANIFNTKKILELYPSAKIIAITRNPLAVYASWKKKDKNKNIFLVIKNWINIHNSLQALKNSDFLYLIKYENLINNPLVTIQSICDFIEEPFANDLLDVEVLNTHTETRGQKGFNQDSLDNWKKELYFLEKLIIKIFTGKLAREFGYLL
jgi:hypothetical protein